MKTRVSLALAVLAAMTGIANADVIISNGTVRLGINSGGPAGSASSANLNVAGTVGVRYTNGNGVENEYTADGCECEGWGVADTGSGVTGFANNASGTAGLTETFFSSTASTATSITTAGSAAGVQLTTTHSFAPSSVANLYEVTVKIENTGAVAATGVEYVRVMDWDIRPTVFREFVEIGGLPASAVITTHNDGFETANPLSATTPIDAATLNVNFGNVDTPAFGPKDHGAYFNFAFGALAPGESKTFKIFYGGADTRAAAFGALAAVGAEVYSLAAPSISKTDSRYSVAIFAFKGVGGVVVGTVPEPTSMILAGCGAAGAFFFRRKKSA